MSEYLFSLGRDLVLAFIKENINKRASLIYSFSVSTCSNRENKRERKETPLGDSANISYMNDRTKNQVEMSKDSLAWEKNGIRAALIQPSQSEVSQLCPTLCDPVNCSLPGSSVHGFSRQEYWSGLPFPSPGDLPDPGIEPGSPTLQADTK